MKRIVSIVMITFIVINVFAQSNFLTEQKRYKRVRTAIAEKEQVVIRALAESSIKLAQLNLLVLVYKAEGEMEIFAKSKEEDVYHKIITYKVCSKSGGLGPKRKQGDCQVPEGFYVIDRFNPSSSFYLSLGINYPNQADRIKSKATNLGGDIFIHGNCVTIGCLPMTDDKIKEIYLYAINAKNNGQLKIPVYIFPFKMSNSNFKNYTSIYKANTKLIHFWANMKLGFDEFMNDRKELDVRVNNMGDYFFLNSSLSVVEE